MPAAALRGLGPALEVSPHLVGPRPDLRRAAAAAPLLLVLALGLAGCTVGAPVASEPAEPSPAPAAWPSETPDASPSETPALAATCDTVLTPEAYAKLAADGTTMLFVTHEIEFARQISNRIVFLEKGVLLVDLPTAQFFDADGGMAQPRVAQFLSKMRKD